MDILKTGELNMKANNVERKKFDKALDDMIALFNDIEDDKPLVSFNNDVIELIEKAKVKYGEVEVNKKINAICRETLSWLPLDDVELEEEESEE